MATATWDDMRERFRQERKRQKGLTQAAVADRGKVEQSAVSKIESDPSYTPSVVTFVNAVHGLGLYAAEFFADIEGLKVIRSEGKVALVLPTNEESPSVRANSVVAKEDVEAFVLDLIVGLQDLVAKHSDRQRSAAKSHRQTAARGQAAARKNARTGTDR